ncbi:MAG: S1/P1 nuclease [Coxiellaceae bacterium]|nr:S1/P1 nuclease [Coxiellaceae bacterium]
MFKKCIAILIGLSLSPMAFSWWATGHALTAEVAYQNISAKTRTQVNALLNTPINFPALGSGHQPDLTPSDLAKSLNSMATDASWADDVKHYFWRSGSEKYVYSDMHYLDIPIDFDTTDTEGYCAKTVTMDYLNKYAGDVNHDDVVNAIRSSLKTLVSSRSTTNTKAIAMRFLIHFMGDMHQPLHLSDPTINHHSSHGGNSILFAGNQQPSYQSVFNKDPLHDVRTKHVTELHAYLDGVLGAFNQLPETIDSSYDPHGHELWMDNLSNYIDYLDTLAKDLPALNDTPAQDQLVKHWALDTSKLACRLFITDHPFTYQTKGKPTTNWNAVFVTSPQAFLAKNRQAILQQIERGGMHLAELLNALYDPSHANKDAVKYLQDLKANMQQPTLLELVNINKRHA